MNNKNYFYDCVELRRYEDLVVKFLNYQLNYLTPFSVLEVLLKNGIVFNYELNLGLPINFNKEIIKNTNQLCFKLLSIFVENVLYVGFNHIDIAFSCVIIAKEIMKFKHPFNSELEELYSIKVGNFLKCYNQITK